MNRSLLALAVLAIVAAGCPGPSKLSKGGAGVKTIVGDLTGACRRVADVTGARGDSGGGDPAGLVRILNATADAGGNAVHVRSGTNVEFKGTAYSCPDLTKVTVGNVSTPAEYLIGKPPANCVDVGVVEEDMAANDDELRERLTKRASGMGGNVMRVDTTGGRRVVAGVKVVTGTGTVFFCP